MPMMKTVSKQLKRMCKGGEIKLPVQLAKFVVAKLNSHHK